MKMENFYICLLHILLLKIYPSVQDMADILALFESTALKSDTYLFVGEELNVTCTLDDERLQNSWTAYDIFFTFIQPKKANSPEVCVDSSKVQVIDSSTAVLSIRNVTLSEAGVFYCYIAHNGCGSSENSSIGHTDDITIQYKPQNVTDFKCVIYNWDDHMKCTWTNPVPYVVENGYKDTFFVIKEGELSNLTPCPQNDSVSCLWPKDRLIQKDNYFITVEVWNAKKVIHTSQMFNVSADQIVKPAPVKDVRVKTLSDQCLELSWTHESYQAKVYRISQQKNGDPEHKVVTDNETSTTYKICDYWPLSVYTFTVDCHPLGLKGYWSDPQVIHDITTPERAPSSGPVVTKGSYNTSACIEGLRNVTLYWQEVDKLSRNGIIVSYSVKLNGQVLSRVPSGMFRATVVINCTNLPLTLNMTAQNSAGESIQPSVISIAPIYFSVPSKVQETFSIFWFQNGSLQSWWEADDQEMMYTLFWFSPFKEPINWTNVSGPNLSIKFSEDFTKSRFGIAATNITSGWTSGIFWTNKSFLGDPVDITCVPNTLHVDAGTESAIVIWGRVDCPYIQVTGFILKYCLLDDCNITLTTQTLSAALTMYTLQPLIPNGKYKITFQIVAKDKLGPEVPELVSLAPENKTSLTVVIVVVVVVTVLLIACSVFLWKCRESKLRNKKFMFDDTNIIHSDKKCWPLPRCVESLNKLVSVPDGILLKGSLSTSSPSSQQTSTAHLIGGTAPAHLIGGTAPAHLMAGTQCSTDQSGNQTSCSPVLASVDANEELKSPDFHNNKKSPDFHYNNKSQDSATTNSESLLSYLLMTPSQSDGSTSSPNSYIPLTAVVTPANSYIPDTSDTAAITHPAVMTPANSYIPDTVAITHPAVMTPANSYIPDTAAMPHPDYIPFS